MELNINPKTGDYLSAENYGIGTKITIVFIDDGKKVYSEKFKEDQYEFKVKLPNGIIRKWTPLTYQLVDIIALYGKDTSLWINKTLMLIVMPNKNTRCGKCFQIVQ